MDGARRSTVAPHDRMALGKGHAGHEGNERADALANRGVELLLQTVSDARSDF